MSAKVLTRITTRRYFVTAVFRVESGGICRGMIRISSSQYISIEDNDFVCADQHFFLIAVKALSAPFNARPMS